MLCAYGRKGQQISGQSVGGVLSSYSSAETNVSATRVVSLTLMSVDQSDDEFEWCHCHETAVLVGVTTGLSNVCLLMT